MILSLGDPIRSDYPNLNAMVLRYWMSNCSEFQVLLDKQGRVRDITAGPQMCNLVVMA